MYNVVDVGDVAFTLDNSNPIVDNTSAADRKDFDTAWEVLPTWKPHNTALCEHLDDAMGLIAKEDLAFCEASNVLVIVALLRKVPRRKFLRAMRASNDELWTGQLVQFLDPNSAWEMLCAETAPAHVRQVLIDWGLLVNEFCLQQAYPQDLKYLDMSDVDQLLESFKTIPQRKLKRHFNII